MNRIRRNFIRTGILSGVGFVAGGTLPLDITSYGINSALIKKHVFEKYAGPAYPEPGVIWKANFYKIAENSSNPHYITWSIVDNPVHDFHLPQFFWHTGIPIIIRILL